MRTQTYPPKGHFVDRLNEFLARLFVLFLTTFVVITGFAATLKDSFSRENLAIFRLQQDGYTLDRAGVIRAIDREDELALTRLKVGGVSLREIDAEGHSPFAYALDEGRHEMLQALIDLGVEPDFRLEGIESLEAEALRSGVLGVAGYLFTRGGDPNVEVEPGMPALCWAVKKRDAGALDLLLKHGATIERTSREGSALAIAVSHGDYELVRRMLSLGGDPNEMAPDGAPLVLAAARDGNREIARFLVQKGADPELRGEDGISLVTWAFAQRDLRLLDASLEVGAPIDLRLPGGKTMLETAAVEGDLEWTKLLLDRGADAKRRTMGDHRPLWWQCFTGGQTEVAELLLSRGADIHALDADGRQPVEQAVASRDYRLTRYLLGRSAKVPGDLWGPLEEGDYGMVRLLAANGADVRFPGPDGLTPVEYAARHSDVTLLGLLMEYGAEVSHTDLIQGHTPLEWALGNKNAQMVQLLLEQGADPNARVTSPVASALAEKLSEHGSLSFYLLKDSRLTPLMIAAGSQQMEAARLLMEHGASRARYTKRYRTYPVTFAINSENLGMAQLMLGREPELDGVHERKIVVSLGEQRARFYRNDELVYSTRCSTGKSGYRTPRGKFVITDKSRLRYSTIYGSAMPFFMRLSGSAVGMHQGYCPGYPASHGCIRLPYEYAKKFFYTAKVGDIIEVR